MKIRAEARYCKRLIPEANWQARGGVDYDYDYEHEHEHEEAGRMPAPLRIGDKEAYKMKRQPYTRNYAGVPPATPGCGGMVLLTLLGVIFSFFGLLMLNMGFKCLRDYQAMKSWKEVPGRVLEARITQDRDNKGRTTYGMSVKYEYVYGGQSRVGTRPDLFDKVNDGAGEYQRRIIGELESARAGGRNVPCYVNPANPAEAVLYREMRWGELGGMMLGGILCLAVGAGVLALAVFIWRNARATKMLQAQHPDEPWLWRRDWAEGAIHSSARGGAIALTVFALIWNAIAWLPLILSGKEIFANGLSLQWLVLLFPLVGVALIVGTVRAWRSWRVLGDAVFHLNPTPGVIGGELAGTIRSNCLRRPDAEVLLTLSCVERRRRGKESDALEIWQDSRVLRSDAVMTDPMGEAFPVLFQIPLDFDRATKGDETFYAWRLELKGSFDGVAAWARFEVPVFRTAASDPKDTADRIRESPMEPY